jgi:hypothetical protein
VSVTNFPLIDLSDPGDVSTFRSHVNGNGDATEEEKPAATMNARRWKWEVFDE